MQEKEMGKVIHGKIKKRKFFFIKYIYYAEINSCSLIYLAKTELYKQIIFYRVYQYHVCHRTNVLAFYYQ